MLYDSVPYPLLTLDFLATDLLVIWIFVDDKCINHAEPHLDSLQSYLMQRVMKLQVTTDILAGLEIASSSFMFS